MKDNTASVLRAGQNLGALFTQVGKTIESKKKEIKTKEILDSFKDPNKIFLKPDGTLANPLEVQQKYNQGFNELLSIGSLNEAKGLASQFSDSYKILANEQANQFSQDAIIVNNPQAKDAFKNTNLSWANNNSIKFASKDTVSPKYYAGKEIQVEDWYNPDTGEIVPGWSSITYISSSDGKYKPIRNGVGYNPKETHSFTNSTSRSSSYNYSGTPDSYIAPSGRLIIVSPNGSAIYAGTKEKVTPDDLKNMTLVTGKTKEEIDAGIDKIKAETQNKQNPPTKQKDIFQRFRDLGVPAPYQNDFMVLWNNKIPFAELEQAYKDKDLKKYGINSASTWEQIRGFYQAFEQSERGK